ncbi:MAG: hypothetical protein HOK52_11015 [Candidatus Marinimicrobia bacterium]|jgi:hypothetical protein|nr:hypothetical protein [Candidatus Neomarinimicrobiota bacterium]MBT3936513.1 hypothetical protein [Candidatus Neomarinimicrobiota bacterium]MBT3960492.1 hypothetical protein [Candidatus Neomarinimicrobiota bacterium]MBT4383903.1 hypothetical protein [Candidatus Neomarinimicrobiota bacterium]MBT4636410.1 hypothetical protein [Candidatus Neomarinimicrobiota bacterium]|tara:strand:- start:520 stop:858 length:339 start_codon:yes stop_codon:yes gene_type:complete
MICPECQSEYEAHIFQCADCNVTLVDTMVLDLPLENIKWDSLPPFDGIVFAEMAGEILAKKRIPYFVKSDVLSTTFSIEGTSMPGVTRIFVPEELKENATLLVGSITGSNNE